MSGTVKEIFIFSLMVETLAATITQLFFFKGANLNNLKYLLWIFTHIFSINWKTRPSY